MVADAARSVWAEARVPAPPARVWRDWALVAVLVPAVLVEGVLREDVSWRPVVIVHALAVVALLPWRRTHPLMTTALAFGSFALSGAAMLLGADQPLGLYAVGCALLLPYALVRWASGRDAVVGLGVVLAAFVVCTAAEFTGVVDAALGGVFLLFPAALGASVRYRGASRQRELEQAKLLEREQIARELHDSVAHHVSAIAVQAQAGRTVAPTQPEAAARILAVIEEAASRTLAEMRTMVGVLRDGGEAGTAPQRGLLDVERLAGHDGHGPRVDVALSGDLDGLRPPVGSAVYRLAQESVTNAQRHARRATCIDVRVAGDADRVRVTVRDDGDPSAADSGVPGYGLIGMGERAALLGGTLEAGPEDGRGWTVTAVLPKAGAPA